MFDHGHRKHLTQDIVRKRRESSLIEVRDWQAKREWDPNTDNGLESVTPALMKSTFFSVLRELEIEIDFADGEADGRIVALANHHKCPVISSDSNFFIFNLEHGFVHFDRSGFTLPCQGISA